VIVFSERDHSMGLLVRQIQDIREEQFLIRMQSQRPGVLGTAIVNGRATDIIDTQHYVTQANPNWFRTQADLRSVRILIVDDSIFFRQLVTTTLETEGYSVEALDSPQRAIQALERGAKFDIIVSDIEMPGMDGCQFAQAIKTRRLTEAPMIALTTLVGNGQEARMERAGFTRYLVKFNAKELLSTIDELYTTSVQGALQEASA
jgi:two-component system, chemotaxis family, sensor kinase CheA